MKKAVVLVVVCLLLLGGVSIASAQGGLNHLADPNYGSQALSAGFTPDPYTVDLLSGGSVDISSQFTSSDCAGYSTSAPDFRVRWSGSSNGLRMFFVGDGDTTMVVRNSRGEWFCSDDYGGTRHPFMYFTSPPTGDFNIWVGSYSSDEYVEGTLYITELSYDPGNLPSASGPSDDSGGISIDLDDTDGDGIFDSQELWLAQVFMPVFEYDEDEHNIITDADGIREFRDVVYLYQVSPVECYAEALSGVGVRFHLNPPSRTSSDYLLTIVASYEYDYVPYDPVWWGEDDLFAHYGDTERVRVCIDRNEASWDAVKYIQVNRHHITEWYLPYELERDGTHPYLYVSEGKHATFATGDECEDEVSGIQWVGWDEDCEGGEVIRPSVLASLNVGEYTGYRVTTRDLGNSSLSSLYPGEIVWSPDAWDEDDRDHYFCGGYDVDDFDGSHTVVSPNIYDSPWCGGTLDSKWWPDQDDR